MIVVRKGQKDRKVTLTLDLYDDVSSSGSSSVWRWVHIVNNSTSYDVSASRSSGVRRWVYIWNQATTRNRIIAIVWRRWVWVYLTTIVTCRSTTSWIRASIWNDFTTSTRTIWSIWRSGVFVNDVGTFIAAAWVRWFYQGYGIITSQHLSSELAENLIA